MIHLGDITKINGAEIEPVDCITAGSPCQDLSVAGKRAGFEGERSGLFMEQIRIIKEMREHDRNNGRADEFVRPRYMVWENVPGAFSSNKGEDFRCVLEETAKVAERDAVIPGPPKGKWSKSGAIMGDGWSIAWRVHDAQFWGVPQRRKRIALVADFGGESAPEILFERKSLSGDIAKSGKEGKGIAENASGSVGKTDATFYDAYQYHGWRESDTSGTLTAGQNNSVREDTPLIAEDMKAIGFNRERCGAVAMDDAMPTLQAAAGESGNNQPMVALSFQERAGKPGGGKGILIQNERTGALSTLNNQSVCYGIGSYESNAMKSSNPHSGIYEAETARTLDLNGGSTACNQCGMAVVQSAGLDGYNQSVDIEVAQPLRAADGGDSTPKVVCIEGNGARESHKGNGYVESETMYTLNTVEQHAGAYRKTSHAKTADDGQGWQETDVNDTLNAFDSGESRTPTGVLENHPNDSRVKISEDGMVQTLSSWMGAGGGNVPMVMESMAVESHAQDARYKVGEINQPVSANMEHDPANGRLVLEKEFITTSEEEKIGAQVARGPGAVSAGAIVRRLTPLECERLQGYPDNWTNIGDWIDSKGKKHKGDADSPRYKALGNSIALPFWFYLLRRISAQYERPATLGSLFDGIGGFPLCWERCNGNGTARWASEIEEFPIAVTRRWFGE